METLSSQEKAMETVKYRAERETADATAAESDAEVHDHPQLRQMEPARREHPPTVQTAAVTMAMHAY